MRDKRMDRLGKIVLSGSPNKNGTTDYLIRSLFPETKIINLYDINILPCNGCGNCKTGSCPIEDNFLEILGELDNSFILVSPIYFLGFPSHVKSFIDRFQFLWQNNKYFKIKNLAIIMHGEQGNYKIENSFTFLVDILAELLNAEKTFLKILHNFKLNNAQRVENIIREVEKEIWNAFFVK